MRISRWVCGLLCAGCALGGALTSRAAAVSEEDFNALKALVQQLSEKVQKLEQAHGQDQQAHEQDQQQIQRLKDELGTTQKTATDAQQKAEAATQVQRTKPMPGEGNATHNFTMVGDAEIQFGKVEGQHSGFVLADFAPIFLFRARDNMLFEAGFDIKLQNNAPGNTSGTGGGATTTFDMSFAQLDYLFNDYVTFVGGDMLLPLGTYAERSAGWLNKIPDDPLSRSLVPSSGIGAQLRGAIPLDPPGQSLTYSAFLANGPGSVDGTGNALTADGTPNLDLGSNVGFDSNGNSIGNLHAAPGGGGRIGWFHPWKPHYDLELGVSGMASQWDGGGSLLWSAAAADAALHIGPYVEVKGEYIYSWQQTSDLGTIKPWGWWIQAGYKLAGLNLELPLINNLELVGRYDTTRNGFNTTQNDFGATVNRWTVGYVYYFSNNLLFEGDYEFLNSNDPAQAHNLFVFQLGYGF
jgi:hypothetical protein